MKDSVRFGVLEAKARLDRAVDNLLRAIAEKVEARERFQRALLAAKTPPDLGMLRQAYRSAYLGAAGAAAEVRRIRAVG